MRVAIASRGRERGRPRAVRTLIPKPRLAVVGEVARWLLSGSRKALQGCPVLPLKHLTEDAFRFDRRKPRRGLYKYV